MSETQAQDHSKEHVLVIGAGPGGYAAAFYAADLGFQVTLVNEEPQLGGVCTLRGCIPSKGLLHVAKFLDEARHAGDWGITLSEPKINVKKLNDYKNAYVEKLTAGIGQLASARKVKVITGRASFIDSNTAEIKAGTDKKKPAQNKVTFDKAIIATGSTPAVPKAWQINDPRVVDSTGALDLKEIPQSLLVIGGGYIGLEMASVYAALGSKVSVVEALPNLLAAADRDLVRPLEKRLKDRFEAIYLETKVEKLEAEKKGIKVSLSGKDIKSPQIFSKVLISVGRRPSSQGLGLENTAVKTDEKGFIQHNAQMRTEDKNIFVIGDVAGEPMLAHKAHAESKVAVEAIAGLKSEYDVRAMPAVIFTDPELAWVGITEAEAKEQNRQVEVSRYPWAASGKAHAIGRTEGVSKVIIDKNTGRIVGAGICGFGAGDLISEYALAIEMDASPDDVSLTVHPHPTLGETMLGAVDVALGHATDIYRPKNK